MIDVVIEPERLEDALAVWDVVHAAFKPDFTVADMVGEMRQSSRYRCDLALVARWRGQVVGFVMLSGTDLVDDDGSRREVLTLAPLAVAPELQRRGIGTALVRKAISAAESAGEPLVVLEGSPDYYGALGFLFAGDRGITLDLPSWAPPTAAQVFLLSSYDPSLRGHVIYPQAIARLAHEQAQR